MAAPVFAERERISRSTFLAMMHALSRPGEAFAWDTPCAIEDALARIGDALLDLETTFYSPDAVLAARLVETTARSVAPASAAYHFYRNLDFAALAEASPGDMLYPDTAATVIAACGFEREYEVRVSGPGIETENRFAISGVPAELWSLRAKRQRYPLGWDLFLVSEAQVVGIPRTSHVEVSPCT